MLIGVKCNLNFAFETKSGRVNKEVPHTGGMGPGP